MKRLLFLNGSPRGKAATSFRFLEGIAGRLPTDTYHIEMITAPARAGKTVPREILETLNRCDTAVISFPLYAYSLPANLTQFFEEYSKAYGKAVSGNVDVSVHDRTPRLYTVVNSGYYDPEVNREALRVMRHFAGRNGFSYRFGAAFGGGMVTAMLEKIPLVNRRLLMVYKALIEDLADDGVYRGEDFYIRPFIPKRVMLFMKDSEISKKIMAKKLEG
ncbi:MAG: NAD(P)H-dependent oxidoreductase [Spirochaetia bacterium]